MAEPDFSGYATRAGLKCSDGRTIMPGAFDHNSKTTVPLVWQHQHNEIDNVLGHAELEGRPDGVYCYGYFNKTERGLHARQAVEHGDIDSLSIYANKLVQRGGEVHHGDIKEVSLVLSGANPGAFIDNIYLKHSEGSDTLEGEAIIYTGLTLEHSDNNTKEKAVAETTVQDVFDSLSEEQKNVVYYMIGQAVEDAGGDVEHSDIPGGNDEDADDTAELIHQEGIFMPRNVFEQLQESGQNSPTLSHSQIKSIVEDAQKTGSFKEAFLSHAVEYGIENIDLLFPDAKAITNAPELISRRMEWVSKVLGGSRHSPFSRIKSLSADITHDEARAKGYIKGHLKKEEWFALAKRVTTPTTIYKKQKLDRDDIIDITDLDVVAWLKGEMRLMLDEEIARAVLVGDGREIDDEDKISESNIRPIAYDDDFYTHKVTIPASTAGDDLVEAIIRARPTYRGAGNPTLYCTESLLTDLLLVKDRMGRRLYNTQNDLEAALRVSSIVTVDVLEGQSTDDGALLGILVNMADYTIGADRGGAVSMFDDFDIDYNQYKYLIETRLSGALTKFKSAMVFSRESGATVATLVVPTFNKTTKTITIPTAEGLEYFIDGKKVTGNVVIDGATEVEARATAGYYLAHNQDADWVFDPKA